MTIRRKGLWYNLFIFPFSPEREYRVHNLCKYFWSTVINILGWFFLIPLVFGALLGLGAVVLLTYPIFTILAIAVPCLFIYLVDNSEGWELSDFGTVGEMIKSYKEKHCPLIKFED